MFRNFEVTLCADFIFVSFFFSPEFKFIFRVFSSTHSSRKDRPAISQYVWNWRRCFFSVYFSKLDHNHSLIREGYTPPVLHLGSKMSNNKISGIRDKILWSTWKR